MQHADPAHNPLLPATLELEWNSPPREINYLDITIYTGPRFQQTGHLDTKLYQKPSNAYSYLPHHSNHPRHTVRGWIVSELYRYVRNSTNEAVFMDVKRKLYTRLIARAYPHAVVRPLFRAVQFDLQLRHRLIHDNPPGHDDDRTVLAFRVLNSTYARRMQVGPKWRRQLEPLRRRLQRVLGRPVHAVTAWRQQQRLAQRLAPLRRGPPPADEE